MGSEMCIRDRLGHIRVCDRVRNGPKTWPPGGLTCFPTGKHTFLGGGHVCGSFLIRSQTRIWSNRAPNFGPKLNPILVANRTQNRTHFGTQNRTHFGTENESILGTKIDQFWDPKSTHFGTQNRPILGLKMDPLLVPKWVRFLGSQMGLILGSTFNPTGTGNPPPPRHFSGSTMRHPGPKAAAGMCLTRVQPC